MNLKHLSLLAVLSGSASMAFASTHAGISFYVGVPAPIIVHRAPPHHAVEVVAAPPGVGYVWVEGHYVWTGAEWSWVTGAWVHPPQPNTVWVTGRWNPVSQNWVAGHWEVSPRVVVAPRQTLVAVGPGVVIRAAPPPLRREIRGHRPDRHSVWVGGYWAWQGGRYAWMTGHWAVPPHRRAVWVEPRWERRGGNWVFIEGRWR